VAKRIEDSEHMMNSRRVEPSLYIAAHKHSSRHRAEIETSARCGCFFCFRSFASADIKTWIDGNQTALCPRCGVDSVLGSASQHRIDDVFLRGMHTHFFSTAKR